MDGPYIYLMRFDKIFELTYEYLKNIITKIFKRGAPG